MGKRLVVAALAALVSAAGSAGWTHLRTRSVGAPPAPRWTAEDTRSLHAEIDRLEDRLMADQARVRFWDELKERHADVSEIACANLGEHAVAIQDFESRVKARTGEKRRRLASAEVPR